MSEGDRDHAKVRLPPPLVGVLTILIGYGLGRVVPVLPGFGLPPPVGYWIGGAIAVVAFIVFGIWPIRIFRRIEQDPKPWTSTPELTTSGPYRITRNPMYLMMLLVCVGFAFILSEAWILILTPVCAVVLYLTAIRHEEAYLAEKFGESYLDYQSRVRRWI